MEGTLLVPYSYSDPDHDFDNSREIVLDGSMESQIQWQKSKEEYEKNLVDTFRKYNPIISRNTWRICKNMAINNEGDKERTNFKQQGVYMSETLAIIRDMNNREITIDELIGYYKSSEMFIIDLQLPIYDQNEELEPEIKAWIRETYKINHAANLTDEQRVAGYTKRDLKLKFKDSTSSALLRNTKMVDIVNNHTFAFLVEQIIFLQDR